MASDETKSHIVQQLFSIKNTHKIIILWIWSERPKKSNIWMVNFLHPSLPLPIHLPCRKGMSTTVEAAPQPKKNRQSHLSDPHNGTGTHNLLPHDDNTTFDAESNTDLPQISSETR